MALPLSTQTEALSIATGAAHDLRNVLFVITAHCERLLGEMPAADPRIEDLRAIQDAVGRGVALTRQMLSDAAEEHAPRSANVNDLIRGIVPLVTRLAGDGVTLTTALTPGTWPVSANPVQIEQIIMNLVMNAREAMPGGGRLVIATENRSIAGGAADGATQFVVISVSDTGSGIDPSVQDKIFEPFFTTRAASGGTGVGLATVRGIALSNGGHVEVSSAPGEGATFRVVLPRGEIGGAVAPTEVAATSTATRILLVENERPIREYLHRLLSAEGYDVRVASSGTEALHVCDPSTAPIDLVLTDVHLPDVNGPDVAKRIQDRWPEVGVVFMSGGVETLDDLSERGRVPVLAKPFTTSDLVRAVRTVLTSRRVA
jgi:two-component system, cell cycle sensor histidine kinase and response regulator CckA